MTSLYLKKPLCVDLYAGLGGWAEGFLSEGYRVVGFDIERHVYGEHRYPGELILQDARTIDGRQLRDAAVIVASPPCQRYSYMAMPWKRAKQMATECRECPRKWAELNVLFMECFRIQREASAAASRYIPMVVENVKGAQPWVGSAKWHFGSYYLWGDVPALMPATLARKNGGGSWFNVAHNTESGVGQNPVGRKVQAHRGVELPEGTGSTSWFHGNTKHEERGKGAGGSCFGPAEKRGDPREASKYSLRSEAIKQHGSGPEWFDNGIAALPSRSDRRKQASAMIAKIPFALSSHIARVFHP